MIPFLYPRKASKNLWFSDVSKGYIRETMTTTGLILVVYKNYVLQYFCFENYGLGDETYISKILYFKFGIFNPELIFHIL